MDKGAERAMPVKRLTIGHLVADELCKFLDRRLCFRR